MNQKRKKEIISLLLDKIDSALSKDEIAENQEEIWKLISYILDKYNSISFYGLIEIDMRGTRIKRVSLKDQAISLKKLYEEI